MPYDPRKKWIPDWDPTQQYSDPGGYNTGAPPPKPPKPPPADPDPAPADNRPFGGNDALWLYNELFKKFGHAGGLLEGGAYKDRLVNETLPNLISQYGKSGPEFNPGWMAYKINELPAEAYWRLRQALGLPPLH